VALICIGVPGMEKRLEGLDDRALNNELSRSEILFEDIGRLAKPVVGNGFGFESPFLPGRMEGNGYICIVVIWILPMVRHRLKIVFINQSHFFCRTFSCNH